MRAGHLDAGSFARGDRADKPINEGPERLDEIIGQVEGVRDTLVLDAECRQQTVSHERARHAGADDRIAIVEKRVASISRVPRG